MGKTLARRYINEVKLLLPSVHRQERIYLKNMEGMIEDFCQEQSISDMDCIYRQFGTPPDTVAAYFATMDTEQLTQLFRMRRLKKGIFLTLTACIAAFLLFLGIILYQEHLMFMRQEMVDQYETITILEENP